jgi:hypothetical protein
MQGRNFQEARKDLAMIYLSTTISMQIAREPVAVYAYVADLNNLPHWATTFCRSIKQEQAGWVMETSLGTMAIRLAPENCLGERRA